MCDCVSNWWWARKDDLNSPRFLLQHGYDCVCVYLRNPNDQGFKSIEQRALQSCAPLIVVDDFGALDWKVLDRLRQMMKCFGDRELIWHGHDYKTNLLGLLLKRPFRLRLVTTLHGWVQKTWKTPLYYAIDRWCLKRYEQVIAVSPDLYEAALNQSVAEERLHLVYNAIDHEHYQRSLSVAEAKARIGCPEGRLLVGAVGRLSAEKGFHLLVEAMDRVNSSGLEAGLVIIGEGGSVHNWRSK